MHRSNPNWNLYSKQGQLVRKKRINKKTQLKKVAYSGCLSERILLSLPSHFWEFKLKP